MIPIRAKDLAAALGRPWPAAIADAAITGASIDSRTIDPGDLFVALRGSRVDGRRFIPAALDAGSAAVLSEPDAAPAPGRVIPVEDPVAGFWQAARMVRERFLGPAIAVGGSAGKTTTKEILRTLLSRSRRVVASEKSFNNHLGVPLTICRLENDTEVLVAEIGTNHPGEIAPLVSLVEPTHAIITSIGAEHLEGFRDVRGVLEEELDLVRALPEGGVAFVNADCEVLARCEFPGHVRVVRCGFGAAASDVRGEVRRGENGTLAVRLDPGGSWMETRLAYGVLESSLLLAAAAAKHLGIPDAELAQAARDIGPAPLRGEVRRINGATLLVDCYNSNPLSAAAALKEIGGRTGKRCAVLGDMLELGIQAPEFHRDLGRAAALAGLTDVLYVGSFGAEFESGLGGSARCSVRPSTVEARADFARLVRDGGTILVKASRGVGLERLVAWEEEAHRA
jgi:UDP-N-acetylmuramoyl-tripeptide--D-alanyl-D-alanine ligase